MTQKNKIVTLATSRNRKESTLQSLHSIIRTCHAAGISATHFIVDDNSNDGTPGAILQQFPQVRVLHGDGKLYWSRGMQFGFNYLKDICPFDFLVAYNDDCIFNPNCLRLLLDGFDAQYCKVGIVVGTLVDPNSGLYSYGGRMLRWRSKWLPPSFSLAKPSDTSYKEVDSLNMNICCISKGLIDKLGFLGKHYHHSGADFDYGLRTKSIGYKVLLAPSTVGCCAENSFSGTSREKVLSPVVRIRRIFSIKEYPLLQTFVYFRSHGGYLWPFWLVIFYLSRFCHLQ